MTDEQVQLFLADLAIIILLARPLGMAAVTCSVRLLCAGCRDRKLVRR